MLSFGTGLPAVQQIPSRVRPWEKDVGGAETIAAARAAEAAGFAWVSCSDHVAVPISRAAAMGATWYDAGSTLAFVAGATSRIRLLSHVLVLPYRHPLVVAKQYGTLDRLSGGRVILGVGSGHLKAEFASLGADFERRGPVTDESIAAIVAAWTEDTARFEGRTIAFRDVMVSPRVVQRPRPPIWVGGNSRAAIRRAARHADGWVPWEVTPEAFREAGAFARSLRDGAPFELVAPLAVPAGASSDAVLSAVEGWRAAGATAFQVGVAAESLAEHLDRTAWFGREVIARLA
ncbi:MAG TPA: TIGR03619 family F420-dependent LLM class oxidoreductase [Candidatus Binatia bacterium]|nr:TIGR03619 family F420-dependent LLM class oxidoreductase [Candidatus Binatia bacterium]